MPQNILQNLIKKASDVMLGTDEEREAKRLLTALDKELAGVRWDVKPESLESAKAIQSAPERVQIEVILAMQAPNKLNWRIDAVTNHLLSRKLSWTAEDIEKMIEQDVKKSNWRTDFDFFRPLQRFLAQGDALTPRMETGLRTLLKKVAATSNVDGRKQQMRILKLLGEDTLTLPDPGETWSDAALADIASLPEETQNAWKRLFAQAQSSDSAKPTGPWRKEAQVCVAAVGAESFRQS